MATKKIKPMTPGQRFQIMPNFSTLTKKKPEKSLLRPVKQKSGRNNRGVITVHYRGGGHKRKARLIDFYRKKHGVTGVVQSIEYDPMRTAFIALIYYEDGVKSYIIAPEGLAVGAKIIAGDQVSPEVGNAMRLRSLPLGTFIHNIELNPGSGAACVRSAGGYAQLVAREGKYATVKLPSGEMRMINKECMATVGVVSNGDHNRIILGKAGRMRWLGRRPRTRQVATNAVDGSMGGGEGKSSGGQPRARRGRCIYSKGQKTRKRNKYSDKMIIKKRK
ncbi:MAG: 50S ribosomal protein L2 [Bacteroidota bacterium]